MCTRYFEFFGCYGCFPTTFFLPLFNLSSLRAVELSVVDVVGFVDSEPFDSPGFICFVCGELYLILLTLSLRARIFIILGLCCAGSSVTY